MHISEKFRRPSFLQTVNDFLRHTSLADILPYRFFDTKNNLFVNDSSVGFLWEITPFVGFDDQSYKSLCSLFQYILPEGSSLQCTMMASPHIQAYTNNWVQQRPEGLMRTLAKKRAVFLCNLPGVRSFTAALSLSIPQALYNTSTQKSTFLKAAHDLESLIVSLAGTITPATPTFLNTILSNIAVFSFTCPPATWNPRSPINTQCIPRGYRLTVHEKSLQGHYRDSSLAATFYTATQFPDQWSCSAMGTLLGAQDNNLLQIKTPFFISYGVHIPNEHTLRSRVLTKCAQVEKQANSPLAKWIPSLAKEALEWSHVRAQCEQGQRIVRTRLQVGLWGQHTDVLQAENSLYTLFRRHHFNLEKDTYTMLPALISCLPMTWSEGIARDSKRFNTLKTTLSHEPPLLLPLQGDWQGTPSPGLLLVSRRGQIASWCPFDNNMGNYNVCVIGRSGSGKSVFMQDLALTNLSRGGHVFVIDVGRSFEKIGKLLGARYISFSARSPVSLNPFSFITQGMEDMLSLIKPILCTMASPSNSLEDIEVALLDKALHSTWNTHHEHTTITLIAHTLINQNTPLTHHLATKLFPYTKDGPYGGFFHGEGALLGHHPFVIVEMEELKERKDLQAVLVQMIITSITSSLYCGNRLTPTHIILDEAWDLLRGGTSADFIETAARRLRKYRGSLVVGTQSPHDFFQSPGAQAAFDNSDWVCFLSQKPDTVSALARSGRFALNAHLEESIKSLHTVQGSYAEVLIYGPHGYAILRLMLDRFSQMLFTTKPEEFAFIHELMSAGVPLMEALLKAEERFL